MGKLSEAIKKMTEPTPVQVTPPAPVPPAAPLVNRVTFSASPTAPPPPPTPPPAPLKRGRKPDPSVAQGAVQWIGMLFCCVCGRHTGKPKDTDFSSLKRSRSKRHCTGCADPANCEACNPAPSQAGRNVSVSCIDPTCDARWTVTRETLRKAGVTFINL